MDEKISLEAIGQYADRYSEKVVKDFFSGRNRITGPDILSLTAVQQVNLFVIRELFRAWKEEQKKVRSPYFDFQQPEVKGALDHLMNLLSKNISIESGDFEPLLRKAVRQALMVTFDPYDYFSMLITGDDNRLDVAAFREELKYLKINKAPLEKMLSKLEARNIQEVSGNEAFGILDQILEEVNFHPDDVEGYIEKFSEVVALDPNEFFVPKERVPEKEEVSVPLQKAEVRREEPVVKTPANTPVSNPQPQIIPQPVPPATVNEKHTRESRSLAENFQRIKSIKESLTINQKFMFTKVLFHGDFELFSRAVDRLDQFDSLPAALRYLENEHATTWDRDSEEFHEFMELIEKRFA